jgi:hypothetical protein
VIALAIFGVGSWLKRIDLSEVQFCLLGVGATVYQHTVPRARCTVLSSESDYLLGTDFVVARETDLFFSFLSSNILLTRIWMRADHCWHTASTSAVAWEVAIWLTLVSDRTNERPKQTLDLDAHLQLD